ncbi:MAG: acyltransferase family protein, partial [bacterium]
IMLLVYCVYRVKPWLYLPVLSAICLVLLLKPDLAMIQLRGNGLIRPPMLGWFLLGVVLAGLNPTLTQIRNTLTHKQGQTVGVIGVLFLMMLIACSCYAITAELFMQNVALPVNFPRLFGVACMFLILLILVYPQSILGRFFNLLPLRSIGIVGYSFYLLHPMVIKLILDISEKFWGVELSGFYLFVLTSTVTWAISLFTYSQIERPFLSRAKQTVPSSIAVQQQST